MKRRSTGKNVLMAANIIALVVLGGATGYLFLENRDLRDDQNLTNEERNARLIAEVEEVFDLPDETPVIGVVRDVDEFKVEFPAFANDDVQTGDQLLFFRKNRLNVLYRSSERRVVKTYNVQVPIAIELVGTQEAIDAARERLGTFGNAVTITDKVDANINQAFVFDVDSDQAEDAQRIADELGIDVGSTLPSSVIPDSVTEIVIAVVEISEPQPAANQDQDQSVAPLE